MSYLVFSKRAELLANKVKTGPVTLTLPDGTERVIDGSLEHFFQLMECLGIRDRAESRGELIPVSEFNKEIEWLANATDFKTDCLCPLFELTAAMIVGPDSVKTIALRRSATQPKPNGGKNEQSTYPTCTRAA